jgi:hypothetical protein
MLIIDLYYRKKDYSPRSHSKLLVILQPSGCDRANYVISKQLKQKQKWIPKASFRN